MADYGIKIAKDGFNATDIPTEATKQNFVILDTTEAHKIHFKGFVTTGSYTHNLGYRPAFFCFKTDNAASPSHFDFDNTPRANTTQITNISNPSYIVVFKEGI